MTNSYDGIKTLVFNLVINKVYGHQRMITGSEDGCFMVDTTGASDPRKKKEQWRI